MDMIKAKQCPNCKGINYPNVVHCVKCNYDISNQYIFDYYLPQQQQQQQYYQQPSQVNKGLSSLSVIGIIASCLMIIGCFMPYKVISFLGMSNSTSLIEGLTKGTSILTPLLFTLGAGSEIFNSIKENYRALYGEGLVMVIWNIIYGLYGITYQSDYFSAEELKNITRNGIGYYLILIGSIALFVIGIVMKQQDKD